MNLTVNINGTAKSDVIWSSLLIKDNINEKVNTCQFNTLTSVSINDEITVYDGTDKIFGGIVLRVKKQTEAGQEKYTVQAVDYTRVLDRQLAVEHYTNTTVSGIINDLIANYASGFTTANVNCDTNIASIYFNYLPLSQCIQKLAEAVNYSWYVDYNKDIHFFASSKETAPFNLTDDNGNYIFNSLVITDDLSQLRNRVRVRGGEIVGDTRTEVLFGDGKKKIFPLANKFSAEPTVTVSGVSQTVGLEFIDNTGYDCYWNYNEKYIRFGTAPDNGDEIDVTGKPLIPIIVQVEDPASIDTYGVHEFYKKDVNIKSTDEAKQYAIAQLNAYRNSVNEARFDTYTSGLKSGQLINIQSDKRGIDKDFIIQSVDLRMLGANKGVWQVKLASLRTIGIIQFLQQLLLTGQTQVKESENEVLYKYYTDIQNVSVTENIALHAQLTDHQSISVNELIRKDPWTVEWVLAPYFPVDENDPKRPFLLNTSSYLY